MQEALASLEAAKAEVTRLTAEAHSARDAYNESANELEIAKKKRDKAKVNTDMKHMNSEEYGVDFSRTNRNDKNDYSQREFWERRYQLSSGTSSSSSSRSGDELYEWYLSYDLLFPLLIPDIRSVLKDEEWGGCSIQQNFQDTNRPMTLNQHRKYVLVSGVGNSSMCEDLAGDGLATVGCDYSDSVIAMMQRRCQEKCLSHLIQYLCIDMTKASQFEDSYFKIVIDKGTLDAILSASEGQETSTMTGSLKNATMYLFEISRILMLDGAMLLISNMPQDVLEQAIALCVEQKSQNDRSERRDFQLHLSASSTCKSDTGETVYYHTLKKKKDSNYGRASLNIKGSNAKQSNDFASIMLDSVKDYMENPEKYEKDDSQDMNKVTSSSRSFQNSQNETEKLRKIVDKDLLPTVELFIIDQRGILSLRVLSTYLLIPVAHSLTQILTE